MKKMISLLSVAALAVVFAAGCGKHTKCDQAKEKAECVKDKFEEGKFACKWVPKAGAKDADKEGECKEEASTVGTTAAAWSVTTEATAECAKEATPTDDAACTAKDAAANAVPTQKALNDANTGKSVVCMFKDKTTPCKAEPKP